MHTYRCIDILQIVNEILMSAEAQKLDTMDTKDTTELCH